MKLRWFDLLVELNKSLSFFNRNNFYWTSFGSEFATFGYGVVGGFQGVKTFGVHAFYQN